MTDDIPSDPRGQGYAQAIVETMQEPVLVLSPDLRVLRVNRAFCQTYRLSPDEVLNQPLAGVGEGRWDVPALNAMLEGAFRDDRPFHGFELTGGSADLGRRTMLANGQMLCVDGEPWAVLLTMEDITDRTQIEAALAASEVRYRRLFETARDGVLLLDAQTGQIVDANPFLQELLGYSHAEVVGKHLWEIGPFGDVGAARASFEKLQRDRYIRYEDLPLQTKDGREISVEFVSNVYPVNGTQIIQCNIRDITERKLAEAALTVSEVRYRRLFEAAQDGILLLDAGTGQIVDVNPFLEDLLQYSHDEMVGMKLWEVGPFRDVEVSRSAFERLQRDRYIRYEDLPLETKSGRKINVEFVSNVYAVDGEQIIQCNIRDITARRQAEEQLHALRLDLEDRVAKRTSELARANLSLQREIVERERAEAREHRVVVEERTRIAREIHDTLAQGFTGIVIQLEAADDALDTEPDAARLRILQARTLARESLAEARRSVWALRPLALGTDDLAYAFLHLVSKLTEGSETPIGFTLQGVLRPLSQDIEHHLLRIGQEALTNALRYAESPEIQVTLTCAEEHIRLAVEDHGGGFATASAVQQQGLGLRGMRERADSLGGTLTITSAPGHGTRVEVVVPLPRGEGESRAHQQPDQGTRS
jgi:PAS domain S-box-containing protein